LMLQSVRLGSEENGRDGLRYYWTFRFEAFLRFYSRPFPVRAPPRHACEDVENYVKLASMEEIAENDYNPNVPLYVKKVIEDDLSTVAEALEELKTAWDEAQKAEARFRKLLEGFTSS